MLDNFRAIVSCVLCSSFSHSGHCSGESKVLGTSLSGIFYALFAGQPLTVIGSTGPVGAYIKCLFAVSKLAGLPFLPLYAWY
jgi:MFS superfamily sulfate permease-like transporter